MKSRTAVSLRCQLAATLLAGLLFAPVAMAETLRLSLQGQLADNGEPANNDYDGASFSGFLEIDLARPLGNGSDNQHYDLSSWDISLVPAPPNAGGAGVIRLAGTGEADDLGELTLDQFGDRLVVLVQENNRPANPRVLFAIFDAGVTITATTRFEDLLVVDNQLFATRPVLFSGGMQFAVGTTPTGTDSAELDIATTAVTRYVDGNAGDDQGGGNTCAVFDNPCATIQQAIDSAQGGDTIQIADAVYTELLSVDKALSMRGQSRSGTIIQAAADRGTAVDRVISVADDTAFELSDATLRHGRAGFSTGSSENGGGLESLGGNLLLERVTFTDNDAEGLGAGLRTGANAVVLIDVGFSNNGDVSTSNGGGAYLGENGVVTDVTMNRVRFESNAAVAGGGLELFNVQAVLSDVVFAGNTSSGEGGGLFYEGSNSVISSLEMSNAAFIGNSAGDSGGGMHTSTNDTPYELVNAVFSGNSASLGGGIYNQAGLDAGERVLTNVTMSGNRAALRGGGIDRPLDMTLRNTIIWNNQDASGTGTPEATMDDFFSNSLIEVSSSLLQGYPANEFPGSGNLDGANVSNNPLFRGAVNPSAAPVESGNLRLRLESPVRDRGDNTFVAGVGTDLDGEARIVGGVVDLGPYEGTDVLFADGFEQAGF